MTVAQVGTDRRSEFAFSGGRSGSGPATWGQQAIWDVVRSLGTDAARYNVSGGMPLPAAVPVDRVEAAVRELVLLHESLRTRLRTADDGRLDQVVHAAGGIPVVSRPATPDTVTPTAYALRDELLAVPFDAEREWPLRVGVVHVGADAHYVVLFLSHTASDGWGLRNLLADFAALLRGPLPARDLRQPLEEAAFQVSDRGRRRDAAARRSWLDKLRPRPGEPVPGARGPGAGGHVPERGAQLPRAGPGPGPGRGGPVRQPGRRRPRRGGRVRSPDHRRRRGRLPGRRQQPVPARHGRRRDHDRAGGAVPPDRHRRCGLPGAGPPDVRRRPVRAAPRVLRQARPRPCRRGLRGPLRPLLFRQRPAGPDAGAAVRRRRPRCRCGRR